MGSAGEAGDDRGVHLRLCADPIGRYAGAFRDVRTGDLAAHPLRERHDSVDWDALDDCIMGCANQAGDDPRVNPHGGAMALKTEGGCRAVVTMCIGVGQGIAALIERV